MYNGHEVHISLLAGWEGSRRIVEYYNLHYGGGSTPSLSIGNYYLVDAGYANAPDFLPHIVVFATISMNGGRRRPQNFKELFNHRHSSLRNVIERTFGLIKKRWAILRSDPFYSFEMQVKIVLACCAVHNYIMAIDPDDPLLAEVDIELEILGPETNELITEISYGNDDWNVMRDQMAQQMFVDYMAEKSLDDLVL
ncbi:hypothetical protein IFM89_032219 [Coptis chinensis]|uniref:DDE Tnp4 domain-containing protein n=1 Tax=Coptis chinensis TaxID=261450 RepID=A0A835LT20_9MAGN|nr:hypothetical protein IFM89_032219 [Coptis chinensis]